MSITQFILIQFNLVLLYGLYRLLSSKKRQLQFNRAFLLLGPILAIALPFVSFTGSNRQPFSALLPVVEIMNTTQSEHATAVNWSQLFIGVVCAIMIGAFVLALIKVLRRNPSTLIELYKGYPVYLLNEEGATTHSIFNRIYLHPHHTEHKEIVLEHEYAHCVNKHSVDLMFMAVYKALFWFNPAVYKWSKEMQLNHEFLADAHVLSKGVPAQDYGQTLLELNFSCAPGSLVHAFNKPSSLRKRIIQFNHQNKFTMKHLIIIPAVIGLAFVSTSLTTATPAKANFTSNTEVAHGDPEVMPEFPGGKQAMMEYLGANIKYPKALEKQNAEGKVFVQFTVDNTGKVVDVSALKSSGYEEMDAEAIRVIKNMPNWTPATKDGKTVNVEMKLPIQFKLAN